MKLLRVDVPDNDVIKRHVMTFIVRLLVLSSLVTVTSSAEEAESRSYCSTDVFDVSCAAGEAILMQKALFGRMKPGKCISSDYTHAMGCYADVLAHLDSSCSGRRDCSIPIGMMDQVAQPCPKDFKSYLEASFKCVPVQIPGPNQCHGTNEPIYLPPEGGFLNKDSITANNERVLSECTWRVQVVVGQAIALYLSAFFAMVTSLNENNDNLQSCTWFIMLEDGSEQSELDLCTGVSRGQHVYLSDSNILDISFYSSGPTKSVPNFLLEYKALGCPDIKAPDGSWVKRELDNVMIRCNDTGETWYLTCRDNTWVGDVGNCTSKLTANRQKGRGSSGFLQEAGIVFAVFIGLILGLFIGTGLLAVAFCCRRRMRRHRNSSNTSSQCVTALTDSTPQRPSYPGLLTQEKPIGGNVCEYTHVWELRPQQSLDTPPGSIPQQNKSDPNILSSLDTSDLHSQSCTIYEPGTLRKQPDNKRLPYVRADGTVYFELDQNCPHVYHDQG